MDVATLVYVNFGFFNQLAFDERVPVRDTAIRVLDRLDAGQGIAPLLEALKDDDRARIAIYALRPVLKEVSKDEALEMLQATSLTRVAVAKEVFRIARDINTETSYRFLRNMIDKSPHRDVFISLLEALVSDIGRIETYLLFKKASQNDDPAIPLAIIKCIPMFGMGPNGQVPTQWKQLLALLLKHATAEVRTAALHRCAWSVADEEQILVEPLFALLNSHSPDEPLSAATAIIKLYSAAQPPLISDVFKRFLESYSVLPKLVSTYTETLIGKDQSLLALARPTTHLILQALAENRLTSSLQLKVMFYALPWPELRARIEVLVPKLHADALVEAEALTGLLAGREGFDLAIVERSLAAAADPQVRRLGLSALMARERQLRGWSGELRERLRFYREDEAVLVAEAAAFVFVPNEEG